MRQAIEEFARYPLDEALWNTFASGIYYHCSTFDDALGYVRLQEFLHEVSERHQTQQLTIYYLATPPEAYNDIVHHLYAAGLATASVRKGRVSSPRNPWPDLDSARDLTSTFDAPWRRADLSHRSLFGKETVQNIMVRGLPMAFSSRCGTKSTLTTSK
jgi:glucose-6-phosphate 1-dehydrogenase